jgi:hypothetical protein
LTDTAPPRAIGFNNIIREITVNAGEDLKINVPFTGAPAPKAYWTKVPTEFDLDLA